MSQLTVRDLMNQLEKMPAGAPIVVRTEFFETISYGDFDANKWISLQRCEEDQDHTRVIVSCVVEFMPEEYRRMAKEIEEARKPKPTKKTPKKGAKK